jgi:hypothetical protein
MVIQVLRKLPKLLHLSLWSRCSCAAESRWFRHADVRVVALSSLPEAEALAHLTDDDRSVLDALILVVVSTEGFRPTRGGSKQGSVAHVKRLSVPSRHCARTRCMPAPAGGVRRLKTPRCLLARYFAFLPIVPDTR